MGVKMLRVQCPACRNQRVDVYGVSLLFDHTGEVLFDQDQWGAVHRWCKTRHDASIMPVEEQEPAKSLQDDVDYYMQLLRGERDTSAKLRKVVVEKNAENEALLKKVAELVAGQEQLQLAEMQVAVFDARVVELEALLEASKKPKKKRASTTKSSTT